MLGARMAAHSDDVSHVRESASVGQFVLFKEGIKASLVEYKLDHVYLLIFFSVI
jgi:hypothetical protein